MSAGIAGAVLGGAEASRRVTLRRQVVTDGDQRSITPWRRVACGSSYAYPVRCQVVVE